MSFVFGRCLASSGWWAPSWGSVILTASDAAWAYMMGSLNNRLISFYCIVSYVLRWVSLSGFRNLLINYFAWVLDGWSIVWPSNSCISSTHHFRLLLLKDFELFFGCIKLNLKPSYYFSVFINLFLFIISFWWFLFPCCWNNFKFLKLFLMYWFKLSDFSLVILWDSGFDVLNRRNVTVLLLKVYFILFL